MNKNINTGVELTEKELECVCGGMPEYRRTIVLKKLLVEAPTTIAAKGPR